jgi:hypothetical protein
MKITLNEHLKTLNQNSKAGPEEIASLLRNLKAKFKKWGRPEFAKRDDLVLRYINLIFETQDYRCTHWLPVKKGQLNGVWNRPHAYYRGWKTKKVMYEVDHVYPINAGGMHTLENFQFLSANANQFVKCSLTYPDLLRRVDLSDALKDRIVDVLARRKALFHSKEWIELKEEIRLVECGA